jgi:ribosomal protein S18 acetylase RimI-like enzyme
LAQTCTQRTVAHPKDTALQTIRPITETEYAAWVAEAVPAYAADKVASGAWVEQLALEMSRKEFESLLPQGRDTADNYLYSILDGAGKPVGTLWFAAQDRGDSRIAYVYDVEVLPGHRRQGHARRAFEALEGEVSRLGLAGIALHVFGHNHAAQALYAALGYEPTNINLYKRIAGRGG